MAEAIPAAGGDADSQRRELKHVMAAAETRGDESAVGELRGRLAGLSDGKPSRESAAAVRREAADGDTVDVRSQAPHGRTPKTAAKQVGAAGEKA